MDFTIDVEISQPFSSAGGPKLTSCHNWAGVGYSVKKVAFSVALRYNSQCVKVWGVKGALSVWERRAMGLVARG